MITNASLHLRPNVLNNASGWINEIWKYKTGYRRSIRNMGGYWAGSWEMSEETGMNPADLRQWFYDFLGNHIEERVGGGVTWEGMLYEMELIENGIHRVRSLDLLYNANAVLYTDVDNDDATASTGWATNDESIARYGRKENYQTLDKYDQTLAEAARDTDLRIYGWPWARPVGSSEPKGVSLRCKALGYIHTMNWRYITAVLDGGAKGNISDYLAEIVGTDCQFLSTGLITANTLQVTQTVEYELVWDWVKEKVELGDGTDPYLLQVVNGRRVEYKPMDWQPRYYWRKGQLFDSIGSKVALSPYSVRPAICRDISYPVRGQEYGSPFLDKRDFALEEVEVGEESGLKFKTFEFDEGEFLAAYNEYELSLQDEENEDGDGSSDGGYRKWKWGEMTDEEKKEYLELKNK